MMAYGVITRRPVANAGKRFENALYDPDGYILRVRVREVPEPVPPSDNRYRCSCCYGRPDERSALYDNEKGKGGHRHCSAEQELYRFRSVEALIADFPADVRRMRGDDA